MTRSPRTVVPFRELRSRIDQPTGSRSITAWRRDTWLSSGKEISHASSRPITTWVASPSGLSVAPFGRHTSRYSSIACALYPRPATANRQREPLIRARPDFPQEIVQVRARRTDTSNVADTQLADERHFAGTLTRMVIEHFRDHVTSASIEQLLELAGESRSIAVLADDASWSTYG